MLSKTFSSQLAGLYSETITVEVDLSRGKPQLIIIGLAAKEIAESKERITSALLNCGIVPKAKKTIVNLAPAAIKKNGSKFDLAIITAILQSYNILPKIKSKTVFFGELGLDGKVRKITGILPLTLGAKKQGFSQIVIPKSNEFEVQNIDGVEIFSISHLNELLETKNVAGLQRVQNKNRSNFQTNYNDSINAIHGQEEAKRALEIVAAGGHNLHFTGPPGSGKSMLAKSIGSILPNLNDKEMLEVNSIHSIAGKIHNSLLIHPPIRTPLPGISATALLGGGYRLTPGELSLSHRGVLFLDEITEYSKAVLESLRIPLETKHVTITRQSGTIRYPANCILLCASNPCPCGYYQSSLKACRCNKYSLERYKNKLSGPLLDRIDLQIFVKPVQTQTITTNKQTTSLTKIREKIKIARDIQKNRYMNSQYSLNSDLDSTGTQNHLHLDAKAQQFLHTASTRYQLSTRGYFKTIKIARTIADLEQNQDILIHHIAEALQYRVKIN